MSNNTMTMTKTEGNVLESHLKKFTLISIFVGLISAVGVGYGFYFDTNSTLNTHTIDIQEIRKDVSLIKGELSGQAVFKGMTEVEQKNLTDRVNRIEQKQDKMIEMQSEVLKQLKITKNN